jgi:hypothetical protein
MKLRFKGIVQSRGYEIVVDHRFDRIRQVGSYERGEGLTGRLEEERT